MNDSIAQIILQQTNFKDDEKNMFNIKTANQWMEEAKKCPVPKMLFGELWHEGELCFLFADTNLGKSILAVQMANAISKGESENYFTIEAARQKVLYFDFELSAKQFEKRYSADYSNHYIFDRDFIRIEINTQYAGIGDFENQLLIAIEHAVNEHQSKILIIDNVTFLKTQSTDTAKEALPLMNALISLKRKYGLSILALAHTPKRNAANPITINDLAGSKHLGNFADSIFALGNSYTLPNTRYIKQIKARATEIIYGADNVIVCGLEKNFNFLRFVAHNTQSEHLHLRRLTEDEMDSLDTQIITLYNENPTLSEREIARQLNTNHVRVNRVLKRNGLKT